MLKYLKVSVIERIKTPCLRTYRSKCAFQLHTCLPVCSWTHLRYLISPFSIYEWQQNLPVVVGIDGTGNLLKTFHVTLCAAYSLPASLSPAPNHSLPFAACSMSSKFNPERLKGPRPFAVCFFARKGCQLDEKSEDRRAGVCLLCSQSCLDVMVLMAAASFYHRGFSMALVLMEFQEHPFFPFPFTFPAQLAPRCPNILFGFSLLCHKSTVSH